MNDQFARQAQDMFAAAKEARIPENVKAFAEESVAKTRDAYAKINAATQDKMIQWYKAAGAIATQANPLGTMGPTTHAYGGTRMGNNPETNVVNQWGFSHEVPNLGVLGASVMGTSGARNPTLTVQALAWRTAEHLVKRWKDVTV